MKRRGVVFKLFAITALFFLLFYAIIMLGQLLFFEKFYQHKKMADLEKKLLAFEQQYAQKQWDDTRMDREIALFITRYKTQLAILTPEGHMKRETPFRITIRENDGHFVKISRIHWNAGAYEKHNSPCR